MALIFIRFLVPVSYVFTTYRGRLSRIFGTFQPSRDGFRTHWIATLLTTHFCSSCVKHLSAWHKAAIRNVSWRAMACVRVYVVFPAARCNAGLQVVGMQLGCIVVAPAQKKCNGQQDNLMPHPAPYT